MSDDEDILNKLAARPKAAKKPGNAAWPAADAGKANRAPAPADDEPTDFFAQFAIDDDDDEAPAPAAKPAPAGAPGNGSGLPPRHPGPRKMVPEDSDDDDLNLMAPAAPAQQPAVPSNAAPLADFKAAAAPDGSTSVPGEAATDPDMTGDADASVSAAPHQAPATADETMTDVTLSEPAGAPTAGNDMHTRMVADGGDQDPGATSHQTSASSQQQREPHLGQTPTSCADLPSQPLQQLHPAPEATRANHLLRTALMAGKPQAALSGGSVVTTAGAQRQHASNVLDTTSLDTLDTPAHVDTTLPSSGDVDGCGGTIAATHQPLTAANMIPATTQVEVPSSGGDPEALPASAVPSSYMPATASLHMSTSTPPASVPNSQTVTQLPLTAPGSQAELSSGKKRAAREPLSSGVTAKRGPMAKVGVLMPKSKPAAPPLASQTLPSDGSSGASLGAASLRTQSPPLVPAPPSTAPAAPAAPAAILKASGTAGTAAAAASLAPGNKASGGLAAAAPPRKPAAVKLSAAIKPSAAKTTEMPVPASPHPFPVSSLDASGLALPLFASGCKPVPEPLPVASQVHAQVHVPAANQAAAAKMIDASDSPVAQLVSSTMAGGAADAPPLPPAPAQHMATNLGTPLTAGGAAAIPNTKGPASPAAPPAPAHLPQPPARPSPQPTDASPPAPPTTTTVRASVPVPSNPLLTAAAAASSAMATQVAAVLDKAGAGGGAGRAFPAQQLDDAGFAHKLERMLLEAQGMAVEVLELRAQTAFLRNKLVRLDNPMLRARIMQVAALKAAIASKPLGCQRDA